MKEKSVVFLSVFLLSMVLFPISASAGDLHISIWRWIREQAGDDPEVNGCTFSPDGLEYKGQYIDYRSACDIHDRAYLYGEDKFAADLKLGQNITEILRKAGVPAATATKVGALYSAGAAIFGDSYYNNAQRK